MDKKIAEKIKELETKNHLLQELLEVHGIKIPEKIKKCEDVYDMEFEEYVRSELYVMKQAIIVMNSLIVKLFFNNNNN